MKEDRKFLSELEGLQGDVERLKELERELVGKLSRVRQYMRALDNPEGVETGPQTVWHFKGGEEEFGPFAYDEMRSFLLDGRISKETLLRKGTGPWKRLGEFYEFSTSSVAGEDGNVIRRSSLRAPFHDNATITAGDQVLRGQCLTVSTRGAFVQLSRKQHQKMSEGQTLVLRLPQGVLSREIVAEAVVRNLGQGRIRGVGIEFTNIGENERKALREFVQKCLKSGVLAA